MLAQLTADPASYAALAATYPGAYTLPALEARTPDKLPGVLAQGIAAAAPEHRVHHARCRRPAAWSSASWRARSTRRSRTRAPDLEKEAADEVDEAGRERWSPTSASTST